MLLSEEKINLCRQKEFDVMKALNIFIMVTVHVYEELSVANLDIPCTTTFDVVLQFLGGPLGATVFMFALGIGISYSKHRTPKDFLIRGIKLFVGGYLLNIARSTIPFLLTMSSNFNMKWFLFVTFNIDILQFAGLSFILFALLKKLNIPPIGVCAIAAIMQAIGLLIGSSIEFNTAFEIYLFGLFVKTGSPSCFPLLLWFIYPSLGLLYAKYLRHIKDLDKFYGGVLLISTALLISFCTTLHFINYDIRNLFMLANDAVYTITFLHVILEICCIMITASIIHFFVKYINLPLIDKLLTFMSKNLNNIYITQWMFVLWSYYFIFAKGDGITYPWIVPTGIIITALSCLTIKLYHRIFKKQNII